VALRLIYLLPGRRRKKRGKRDLNPFNFLLDWNWRKKGGGSDFLSRQIAGK